MTLVERIEEFARQLGTVWLYPMSLLLLSLLVMGAERRWPWRKEQAWPRAHLGSDLLHLVFNGHFLGVIFYAIGNRWLIPAAGNLFGGDALQALHRDAASSWPVWLQIVVALFVTDFIQWCVHNLLHRVPLFWKTHQVHHSVADGEMDWIVSFRFQWTEVVIYKVIQYAPLAWFGFGYPAVMTHALFGTLIGHLNHANLDLGHGAWRYLLNSPRMHIWHHNYDADGKSTVNFGIIFSCWDWIFQTAYMPSTTPRRLGYVGDESMPRTFFAQMIWPLSRLVSPDRPDAGWLRAVGLIVVGVALWWALQPV